jgi:thiamine-phosphate pyrophosphorylase
VKPALPRLLVITDWALGEDALLSRLEAALTAGPDIGVQHRWPGVDGRTFLRSGERLASLCQRKKAPLFVNGRLDVALLLGAHLHLPSNGLSPLSVRPHLPEDRLVSIAVHSESEAVNARGADFALVSPVFTPGSKRSASAPLGLEGFARLSSLLPCPAFALGGVSPESATGLPPGTRLAAISSVLHAADPQAAAAQLLRPVKASSVE